MKKITPIYRYFTIYRGFRNLSDYAFLSGGGREKFEDLKIGHMYGDKSSSKLPYFILMNIEALRTKFKETGRKYPITSLISELVLSGQINMIAIDEVHKNMSPASTQGKLVLQIKKVTGRSAEWIPMTGTPIVNKPTDVFIPLKLVDGHAFKNYYKDWIPYFCISGGYGLTDIIGYKNIPELKKMLQGNMLRRLKKDVLDLPPKIYYTEYVENTPIQERLYESVQRELLDNEEEIISSMNPLAKMLKLRQVNGSPELVDSTIQLDDKYLSKNAKLARLMELLDEIIMERNEKIIVFSNWVEPLKTLYTYISAKYKTTCFIGTMSEEERQKHKRIFICNPEYKVMLGSVGALGVNHTLTVANNVIFLDQPWNPATQQQCEDRIHRIGSTTSANIYTLITKNTIDEVVYKILKDKEDISNYIVDDNLSIRKNPELFHKLLG